MKQIKYLAIVIFLAPFFFVQSSLAQNAQSQPAQPPLLPQAGQQSEEVKKEKRFLLFFRKDAKKEQYLKEKRELSEKYQKERKEAREKYVHEKEEARKKKEAERNKSSAIMEEKRKNKELARDLIIKREKEIKTVHKTKRYVEVVTNENDPLFIAKANVLDSKTNFLKIKGVEIKYKLEVYNQTPKVINTVLIVWERKIPFSESQTVVKETKVSKPITPYEKRIIEYNDLDTTRQGETYKVKIANIIFEDGTQWKNPSL